MKFRFFDFEVFPNWWCCVFADEPEDWSTFNKKYKNTFYVVKSTDRDARDRIINLLTEKGIVACGYNIKGYDLPIANGIYNGFSPEQIYLISKMIINPSEQYSSKEAYRLFPFTKRRMYNVVHSDLMNDGTGSLKEKEAILGMDILESSVPFDKENLTESEKDDIIFYCKQDVYASMEYYRLVVKPYVTTKLTVGKVFGIPEETCYNSTNAKMVALVLKAKRYTFEDEDKVQIELPERIKRYCIDNVPKDIYEYIVNNAETLKCRAFNNDVNYGNGGIHSVYINNLYVESDTEYTLENIDATSYYPSILIQLNCLSRCVTNPKDFEKIFDERVAIKHKENKTSEDMDRQLAYKLILNTTFGASGNKYLELYDPHMCTRTCRVGQLLLTALAEKLVNNVPDLKIIQSNTDGILVYYPRKWEKKVRALQEEWTKISGINMENDIVQKIWQRDVNNYLMVMKNGKIKIKGGWLNDDMFRPGSVTLSPTSAVVCSKAAQEFLLYDKDIVDSIVNNNNLRDFIIVCTKGPTYREVIHRMNDGTEVPLFKANRVIATKDESYGSLYKVKYRLGKKSYVKMPSTPEHSLTMNKDLSEYDMEEVKKTIDYMYYVQRTMDLLDIEWYTFNGNELIRTNRFNYE